MPGIVICGLNGCGKSTLGRALAARLDHPFLDNEDLYFPKTDPGYAYAGPRTAAEAEALFLAFVRAHPDFVYAAVRSPFGAGLPDLYRWAVLLEVPRPVRLRRVWERSFRRFGDRMLPGGDLYDRETAFFRQVRARPEDHAERWALGLGCPVLRMDGTRPIEENAASLAARIRSEAGLEEAHPV